MKAIVESFEELGILANQEKLTLQTTGLATQLLDSIKNYCECLVKRIETMESATYTIKDAMQAIHKLDVGEDTCSKNRSIQNSDISKVANMERPDILPALYSLLQHFHPTTASVESFCRK